MQEIALNWAGIGQAAAMAFAFGIVYALFVRWMAWQKIENMTAFVVALGVLVTVLISAVAVGWASLAVLLVFVASGAPMIVEYVLRVHNEDKARRAAIAADTAEARRVAKDLLR